MRPAMLCPAFSLFLVISVTCFTVNANKKKDKKVPEWKADSRPFRNEFEENKHEGTDAELSCQAKGQPKPTVEWFKDGDPFFPRGERNQIKKPVLHFQDLKISDKGNYTCVVSNELGRLEFTYVLDVIEKVWPLNVMGPKNMTVYEGQDAEFFCRATNDPRARITWLKKPNEIELAGNPRPAYLQGVPGTPEVLLIQNVTQSDVGQYTCMAGNYYGSKYQDAWLVVLPRTTTTTTTTTTIKPTTTSATTTITTAKRTSTTTTISFTTTTTTRQPSVTEKMKKKDNDRKKKKERKDKKKKKEKKNRIKEPENVFPDERYKEDKTITSDFDNSYPIFPDNGYNFNPDSGSPDNPIYSDTEGPYDFYTQDPRITNVDIGSQNKKDVTGSIGSSNANKASQGGSTSGISVWTVYIIVGSVAGGILLTGLIAIGVALCCQKDEDSQYKSTSV